jgi:peptide/nickel transport system substrate-binding protein
MPQDVVPGLEMVVQRWRNQLPELPRLTASLAQGLPNGAPQPYSDAGAEAEATGCWLNVADIDDFMVAQPWLKVAGQAHAVSNPNSLRIAALTVG